MHMFAVFVSAVHAFLGVSVVDGGGETPGPFPNPEAKPARADGTAPGRGWESKLPPTQQLNNNNRTPQPQEASPQQRATTRWSGGAFLSSPGFCRGWLSGVDEVVDGHRPGGMVVLVEQIDRGVGDGTADMQRGIVRAEVLTAMPLPEEYFTLLQQQLGCSAHPREMFPSLCIVESQNGLG